MNGSQRGSKPPLIQPLGGWSSGGGLSNEPVSSHFHNPRNFGKFRSTWALNADHLKQEASTALAGPGREKVRASKIHLRVHLTTYSPLKKRTLKK